MTDIVHLRRLRTPEAFRERIDELGIDLGFDPEVDPDGPLAEPLVVGDRALGNRFCTLPMEGWDGDPDGSPSDLVERRWRRFGESGAKLVWGGEAAAVRHEGRANPNQLVLTRETAPAIARLRERLVESHAEAHGRTDDLLVGLQLTHSGRFSRPAGDPAPRIAYRHPVLDGRVGVASDDAVLTDEELDELARDFVRAAALAREAGFDFVDVKHCHGYLGHELLSAYDRPGRYGGDLAGRTRFLRSVVEGIRDLAPELEVAVRLSVFDLVPYTTGPEGVGEPEATARVFGGDGTPSGIDLTEPDRLLSLCEELDIRLVCVTAGSPYYCPHVQRPAYFPPSDGYLPPEDPLVGVARLLDATAELKRRHPDLAIVGSGYSYLQEWLPHVAQHEVRTGRVDAVGIGRMALPYPTLPADVLAGRPLEARRICRTFSECTTAPRNGMISGCYPLDPFYKERPERKAVLEAKRRARHHMADPPEP